MKEALKLALEALQWSKPHEDAVITHGEAITAIKAALAQDETSSSRGEQEPVAFLVDDDLYYPEEIDWETLQEQGHTVAALYTSPPAQRTWGKPWVSLTDDEIWKFWCSRPEVSEGEDDSMEAEFVTSVRAVLAAHGIKEKNT